MYFFSFLNKYLEPACGWRASSLRVDLQSFSRVFPHSFEQQASVSLLHLEAQLLECGVVGGATALQNRHLLLVLLVVF